MTSSYGVMDFNTLKKENQTGGTSDPLEGEVAVNEANLESLIKDSDQHLTILFVTSARVNGGAAFTDDLRSVLAKHAGTIRLAILDADQQPRVAAALRIQSLPTAVLLMKGQVQPLFEGVVTKEQLAPVMEELAGLAAKEGMHTEAPRETTEQAALPEALEKAYTAMESGDMDGAETAFTAYLDEHPGDSEAKKGLAVIALMRRTQSVDLQAGREAAASNPKDIDAQLLAADLDLLGGHVDDAFARLLTSFRDAPSERDRIRERLLELFDVVGVEDERVLQARKKLSRLMF
ncbi:hypothetical protein HMPREF3157_09180 [Dermabacter sp. HMSC06F07]|uniref:co-chaperone YbbN n=1 Tax=Dermabacter TaxID=36739 RepID=UPI0003539946|nr:MULTISPECIES: tetratricopeptide repeat protein [Dermabacter]EPH14610.1 hypothetical protein HMPREF1484_01916 [Dermabacter sp. HFH0086]MCT1709975.1 tetratricopeptide repeat protein [Dermabacter hominis]MDU6927135.1 tetratricopeptide repeat protein [Dermabacter sp.]OFT45434.1 hypothetical protein HMPREF3157_09180 [Dermabacter sp. HMSC06F07]